MMKRLSHVWQLLVLLCLATGALSSCGSDEPDAMTIDYYVEVEEAFLVNSSPSHTDRYDNPVTLMRESIHKAYPNPDKVGNDEAVIAACDETYDRFYEMYTSKTAGGGDHLTCLMHLVKVNKEGPIVRQSEYLKTYSIDVNPIEAGQ